MKIEDPVLKALNVQANHEFVSAYMYLSISYDMAQLGLKGFAHWLRVQYEEEREHAFKILSYIEERGGQVELLAVPPFAKKMDCPLEAAKAVLAHEQAVTGGIHKLYALARSENDYATEIFLQWFVTEQVEEEANAQELVDKFTCANQNPGAVHHIDGALGARK